MAREYNRRREQATAPVIKMSTEARDKVTEILGCAPSFEDETIWKWQTVMGEFILSTISISMPNDSFIVFIHNLKAGPRMVHPCPGINEVIEITTQYNKKAVSMQADIDRYRQVMWDIKWRMEIIAYMDREDHPKYDISLLPLFMKAETIALHIRRIIESIALASFRANEPLYKAEVDKLNKKEKKKLENLWRVEDISKYIEKRNPDFYPKPIEPIHITDIDDIGRNIRFIEDGYMTRGMCLEVYDKCSKILHSQKPFGDNQDRDYEGFLNQVPVWIELIVKLLNYHVFRFVDPNDFYVVHMHDDVMGDYPFMYPLSLEKLPPEIQEKLRGENH